MSRSIVRDMLQALEVQYINELMDDGKHYIIEVCKLITSENKQRIKELDAENVKLRICLWNLAADPDHVKGMANRIEELQQQVDEKVACLKLVMLWVENWDTPFTEDDEWREDDYPRIQKAIYGEAAIKEKGDE